MFDTATKQVTFDDDLTPRLSTAARPPAKVTSLHPNMPFDQHVLVINKSM